MGLKTVNYVIPTLGITIDNAYAKIISIIIDKDGNAKAYAGIQQTRDNVENLEPLEIKEVNYIDDKLGNTYELAYIALKSILSDWEDDIPEAEEVLEEALVQ